MKKLFKADKCKTETKNPPSRSKGALTDIRFFLLNKPKLATLIKFKSESERQNYTYRIMQRLGIDVTQYAILNMHQIGIEAPIKYVFEELLKWSGDSTCWPNYIAKVDRTDDRLENIQIVLFGFTKYPFGLEKGFLGLSFFPLFNLNAIRFQLIPKPSDFDNARYLLYRCHGGYPIGIFSMYVRSSIVEQGEVEPTQLFLIVGFNFYGKKEWSKINIVNRIWESIHDRVTTNVMNRFKQLCEWRFEKIQEGHST